MKDDARAKIKLGDGREVWREVIVRYRNVRTGKWVSSEDVAVAQTAASSELPVQRPPEPVEPQDTKKQTEKWILEAVQKLGLPAGTFDEALGQLLAVQAEIALDKDNGAKATSAARLIGQVTGMLGRGAGADPAGEEDQPWFVLGRELARHVLALIEEEQARREIL